MARRKKSSKKKGEESKVNVTESISHPIQSVFSLLSVLGVAKTPMDIRTRYEAEGGNVSIAVPSAKFAIAFEGDDIDALTEKGWHIERVPYSAVESFSKVYFAVNSAIVAEKYAKSDPNIKNTSRAEEKLMSEIIRRRLPTPDRNRKFTRADGTELTTPDFTWEDARIAFFMDGSYWHSIKDDQSIIKEIQGSKKMRDSIVSRRKDKVRKDGAIRSELGAMGWIVLSCTDDDLETTEGVHEQVDLIARALERASIASSIDISDEDSDSILSMLEDDSDDDSEGENPIAEDGESSADQTGDDDEDDSEGSGDFLGDAEIDDEMLAYLEYEQ